MPCNPVYVRDAAKALMVTLGTFLFLYPTSINAQMPTWTISFVEQLDLISIPLDGSNSKERAFTLRFANMRSSNIARFIVKVKSGALEDSFEVSDREFSLSGGNIIVPVTYTSGSFPATAPGGNTVTYEFQGVSRTGNFSNILTSNPIPALWNVPNVWYARYGKDEPGGDDWATAGTWQWLKVQRRKKIFAALDNIAGEHGTALRPGSHDDGTQVDALINPVIGFNIKNSKRKPSVRRKNLEAGARQYAKLISLALDILDDDPLAEGQLREWLDGQRASLEALKAQRRVLGAEYLVGGNVKENGWQLKRGWLFILLCRGQLKALDTMTDEAVTVKIGKNRTRDLECGTWLKKGGNVRLHLNLR